MKKTIVAVFFLSVLLQDFSSVKAETTATTRLSGGGSLKGNYNITYTDTDTTEYWNSTANAFLSLVHSRSGEKGGLSLGYATNYQYSIKEGTSKWSDHKFNLNGNRDLSNRLRFNLSDTFIMTNDLWGEYLSSPATGIPEPDEPPDEEDTTPDDSAPGDPPISVKIGAEKFWHNYFSTNLNYQYARNGTAILGYSNRIFEYDEPDKDSYKYNNPWGNLSYRFTHQWNAGLSYSYTDAQYDISEDFIVHDAGFNLNYVLSVQDTFFAGLKYYEKDYDSFSAVIPKGRSDYYAVRANLGWTHNFSPHKTFSFAAGPAYLNYEDQDPYTTTYFDISYTSQFENGSWFIGANGGFDDRSFNGFNEGVSEYQRASTGVSWQVAKDVTAGVGAFIRTDDFLENPLNSDEKTYNCYANILYRFWRWFYVSGRYWYVNVDAELAADDSEEHRFFITLGASRELYRWIHR